MALTRLDLPRSAASALDEGAALDALGARGRLERLPPGHRTALPDPRRADRARLQREVQLASQSPIVNAVLETSDAVLLVLNPERQIVAFNSRVEGIAEPGDVRGLRPGEALGCVNSRGPGGCGASAACASCGALGAIQGCQERRAAVEAECTMQSEDRGGRTFEFNARAAPVTVEGSPFTVLSLRDISAERRRKVLEQVFFHDVLNTVAGLRSWSTLLRRPGADPAKAADRVDALSRQLERELKHQRARVRAEDGTLVPEWADLGTRDVLEDLRAVFAEHPLARDRSVELDLAAPSLPLRSDRALVVRILVNAVCNGLEASGPGEAVRVRAEPAGDGVRFHVHSAAAIPAEAQARVFQRSFSTKAAAGRGLGTYSMKLFGERVLGGRVGFVSAPGAGTTFTVSLPRSPPAA